MEKCKSLGSIGQLKEKWDRYLLGLEEEWDMYLFGLKEEWDMYLLGLNHCGFNISTKNDCLLWSWNVNLGQILAKLVYNDIC